MNRIDMVDRASLRDDIPTFGPGDTVDVYVRVVEGTRERVQKFTGIVIRRQGGGIQETFTVRKVTQGVGVERTFPIHSPIVSKIERITLGDVLADEQADPAAFERANYLRVLRSPIS